MNIFTTKMKEKSTDELVDILDNKAKYQKDAIIAVVEELKNRNYNKKALDEDTIGIKLKETPETLFEKLKPNGYHVDQLKENLIIVKRKILFGMEVFRFEKERILIGKKTFFKNEVVEYKRTEIKDIVVDIDSGLFSPGQRSLIKYTPMSISLITLDGNFVELFKIPSLDEYIDETEEYFEKIIEILKMTNKNVL